MEPIIFELRLEFKPQLTFFKFGLRSNKDFLSKIACFSLFVCAYHNLNGILEMTFYWLLIGGCDASTNCGGYACNNDHECLVGLQSITLKTQSCTGCQGAQVITTWNSPSFICFLTKHIMPNCSNSTNF